MSRILPRSIATVRSRRRALAFALSLLAGLAPLTASAGGLDLLYPGGGATPPGEWPGLDIFAGRPAPAPAQRVVVTPPRRPVTYYYARPYSPGEWPGLDIFFAPRVHAASAAGGASTGAVVAPVER